MTNEVQKIKDEIERRINLIQDTNVTSYADGWIQAYKELLKFIDSLQEEPKCIYNRTLEERKKFCKYCSAFCTVRIKEEPASEGLEEEIIKVWKDSEDNGNLSELGKLRVIARHFAEWQRQKDQETIELAEDHAMLAGMNRMKEEMMKDAFIDEYIVHDGRIDIEGDPLPSVDPIILLPYPKFKPNDRVKIIIVKED